MFKIAILCGGPSLERGISLNSARSLLDHLSSKKIAIIPFYVDQKKIFYKIPSNQLYSNTPDDFDYIINKKNKPLTQAALIKNLQQVDLVFPAIHGEFGEDGELQSLLETFNIPFIGSASHVCKNIFNKYLANKTLSKHNKPSLPTLLINSQQINPIECIQDFFIEHQLKRAVVKPCSGGSSIGIHVVNTVQQAHEKCQLVFSQNIDDHVIIEPFISGKEFTVVVLQNPDTKKPIALLPTEIHLSDRQEGIFDYRRKYLPTTNTYYHTPPTFPQEITYAIQRKAEELFTLFGMRDFARLDGWLLADQQVIFSDFNPISGMEQNSFLFRQSAVLGFNHQTILHYIIETACSRYKITKPELVQYKNHNRKPVHILLGGNSSERQVSLLSGTNVWLKLIKSKKYQPSLYFLDHIRQVWALPYAYALNHTTEEIFNLCLSSQQQKCSIKSIIQNTKKKLNADFLKESIITPQSTSLEAFIKHAAQNNAYIFLALHGGIGEDGTIQKLFAQYNTPHNGSDSHASELCMDKYTTALTLENAPHPNIIHLPKRVITLQELDKFDKVLAKKIWEEITTQSKYAAIIAKPRADGCSSGIVILRNRQDLCKYVDLVKNSYTVIPENTFTDQHNIIEMPNTLHVEILLEPFIEVDHIAVQQQQLTYKKLHGWIELTIGIIEHNGIYHCMPPSITILSHNILSLEDKFQGGTGINLTPPPLNIISTKQAQDIQQMVTHCAKTLNIKNYARLDVFYNRITNKMILIEANTLPALTPSTVLFHQVIADKPTATPQTFIESIIKSSWLTQKSLEKLPG